MSASAARLDGSSVPDRLEHVGALDGLRGLAVLVVVLYHQSVWQPAGPVEGVLPGGFLGVDIFFVLSGFLITTLLLMDHAHRGSTVSWRFWERRIRRLLPALLALLALSAAFAVVVANPWELESIRRMGFASLFYVSNWYAIFGHFTTTPLSHTWSLAIEEQWYLLWPLLLAGLLRVLRSRRTGLLVTTVVLAGVSFALMGLLFQSSGWVRAYYGTDTRAWELLLGAALAMAVIGRSTLVSRWARVLVEVGGIIGLVVVGAIAAVATPFDAWMYPWGFGVVVLCGTTLVLASLQPTSPVLGPLLRFQPLVGLGLISYGLYLYHVLVFKWLSPTVVGLSGWPLEFLRVAVALALSVLSYRYLEMPVRRAGFAPTWARWLAPVAVALVAGLVLATTVDGRAKTAAESRADYYTQATVGLPTQTLRVLVAGDGESYDLSAAGTYGSAHVRGIALPLLFCSVYTGRVVAGAIVTPQRRCPPWSQLFREAVRGFAPDVTALVSSRNTVFDRSVDGSTLRAPSDTLGARLVADVERVREVVTARGGRMMVVGVMCAPRTAGESPAVASVAHDESRRTWVNGVLREFVRRHPRTVGYVDADAVTCPHDGVWPTTPNGHPVRSADGRLTPAGTRALWSLIATAASEQGMART